MDHTGANAMKGASIEDSIDDADALKSKIMVGAIAGREVQQATSDEHNMTFLQAVKLYPKAVAWSMFFSLGIIMTVSLNGLDRRMAWSDVRRLTLSVS